MAAYVAIRPAALSDVAALVAIECACFAGDRISRRSFVRLLRQGNCSLLLDVRGGQLRGYLLLLFRRNSPIARVYSIATHPAWVGQGVAAGLLAVAEQQARSRGCTCQRLEIRLDNAASLQLFARRGYRIFGHLADYYHDGTAAFRLEKSLVADVSG